MSTESFLPYGRQQIEQDDIDAVSTALTAELITTGPEIAAFEADLCEYTGARYAVAVANGTAALHLAVLALGLPRGSIGVTTPNTFVATANALLYAGHTPRFVDIDAQTYCMSPECLAEFLDSAPEDNRADVVLPVHFAGNTAGVEAISDIAKRYGLRVIEDASHSIGGKYRDGSRVGSCRYSDMTTFSFHPVKTMTTGEGGAIMTNDPDLYRQLMLLRTHGITRSPEEMTQNHGIWYYEMQALGFNYRITDIQGALGRSQLRKLDRFVARRQELVDGYNKAFADVPWLTTPWVEPDRQTGWHLYVLQFDWDAIGQDRPTVMARIREQGIGSQVLYIPVHTQPYYRETYGFLDGDFPVAETYYENALAIPLYPGMTAEDQIRVITAVLNLA
ncbi:MAG: UDP-4-amino-4,6-dideoxy-N-acetyl-beta-L-altrosamine transaminase [Spirochaeta sp.]|jgi:UDP-4-amino-4,6-dideoxy-N-acetyl-beta-L-altrosamine transaminase|nr:UDP-4-amino-4,6-dideoxy-N-acetyl-beta-L-altrosamine transaminase [Spirochaeta sp.]